MSLRIEIVKNRMLYTEPKYGKEKNPQFPSCYLQKIQLSPNCSKLVGCSCKLEDKGHYKIFVLVTRICAKDVPWSLYVIILRMQIHVSMSHLFDECLIELSH